MRTLLVFGVALLACGPRAGNVPVEPPVKAAAAPEPIAEPVAAPPPPVAPELDENQVESRAHDFFSTMDRADAAAFQASLAPSFIMFEDARYFNDGFLVSSMKARTERHAPAHTREWSEESVYRGPGTATFIGRAVEHVPAEPDRPATEYDGFNSVVFVRHGDAWQVAYVQWTRAGIAVEREHWNERFQRGIGFKKEANQLLVDTTKDVKPGTALDLLMGQGRNALYLAAHGWKVTGIDISDEGIKRAKEAAAKQKLALTTIEADVDHYDLGTNKYDLVTMIYAGDDLKLVARAQAAVKPHGLFVLEYFHIDSTAGGGYATGALAKAFADGWEILRDDVVEDTADWSLRKQKLVRFVARKR